MASRALASLSFVTDNDFWMVDPIEDWGKGNARGREIADECLAFMQDQKLPIMLGYIVKAMMEKSKFGAVEVGFFHRISERILLAPTL